MKRILISAVVLSVSVAALRAGERFPTRVFGGYSVETLRAPDGGCSRYNGWNASVSRRLLWNISLVADFGGHYGREHEVVENRARTFLFGPEIAPRIWKIEPFARFLFGASQLRADAGGPVLDITAFTLGAGGGVDLRVTRRWSVRIFQLDYLRRQFFGEPANGGRISGGLVFHFGE